jgi:hypothetical protein
MTWEWQNLITPDSNYNLLSFSSFSLSSHKFLPCFRPGFPSFWRHSLMSSASTQPFWRPIHMCKYFASTQVSTPKIYMCGIVFAHLFDHYVASSFCFSPHTATKIPFIFPEKELCGLSPNFHSCVCERLIHIPRIRHIFFFRLIMGIYKSLPDTWMWKLGLTPRNSFSGNICSEYSVSCPSGII